MNVIVRPATYDDAAEIANVHINSWREAYKGLMPEDFLNDRPLNFKNRYQLWKRVTMDSAQVTFVAESKEHGVIGFINGCTPRDPEYKDYAEVYAVYLLEKYKGQKIGLELFKKYFNEYKKRGFTKAYLWVLKDNPTIKFYESTGGRFNGHTKEDVIAGQKVTELCYVWDNLDLEKKHE